MTAPGEHLELLKNSVRQSVAALTLVEVDTVARACELVDLLKFELNKRPSALLSLTAVPGAATRLLDASRKITGIWHSGAGVLFLIDDGQKKDEKTPLFWVDMNAQRESWDALNCHIIFFLLPSNYRLLLQTAEHLADWMPLKLHITDPADGSGFEYKDRASYQKAVLGAGKLTPKTAKQQVAILEKQLSVALHEGIQRETLARRYYLPMFEAAMSLSDLNRAQSLRQKVSEKDLQAGDILEWWKMNFWLDYLLHHLAKAESWADKLNKWADKTGDHSLKAESLHNLGMIAEERGDFEKAEQLYKKSLKISEQLGDEHGAAGTYHHLGIIAQERGDFEKAEDWYKRSLKISEQLGDEHGAAGTYHELGMVAGERREFEKAEQWHNKSLKISERLGNELGAARTYHYFGMIAEERREFEKAEDWYKKSLKISEQLGDEHGAARTYWRLGHLGMLQGRVEDSGRWSVKSIAAFSKTRDPDRANQAKNNFLIAYQQASQSEQRKLKQCWENAGLGQLPDAAAGE
ncbi:MAG: tetratricopeptide repeat protein [Desulfobacteraceae bacterium]|nr:tetratricopeptide repeat protein [Desulfobacteraceae bacterium]MBC2718967.1 tetratricopeptide repeat protein [Desulfobacteraceae bacterium]